jgi:DNA-binding NtrC family response regulator
VLVVDDEADNLATFRRVFRGEYKLTLAASAAEAREHLAKRSYDVVFSDYAMPSENGVSLLDYVKDNHPETQRFLVTAYADLPEVRSAADTGVVSAIILKPWDRDVVARWVAHGQRLAKMRRGVAKMSRATDPKE